MCFSKWFVVHPLISTVTGWVDIHQWVKSMVAIFRLSYMTSWPITGQHSVQCPRWHKLDGRNAPLSKVYSGHLGLLNNGSFTSECLLTVQWHIQLTCIRSVVNPYICTNLRQSKNYHEVKKVHLLSFCVDVISKMEFIRVCKTIFYWIVCQICTPSGWI